MVHICFFGFCVDLIAGLVLIGCIVFEKLVVGVVVADPFLDGCRFNLAAHPSVHWLLLYRNRLLLFCKNFFEEFFASFLIDFASPLGLTHIWRYLRRAVEDEVKVAEAVRTALA